MLSNLAPFLKQPIVPPGLLIHFYHWVDASITRRILTGADVIFPISAKPVDSLSSKSEKRENLRFALQKENTLTFKSVTGECLTFLHVTGNVCY